MKAKLFYTSCFLLLTFALIAQNNTQSSQKPLKGCDYADIAITCPTADSIVNNYYIYHNIVGFQKTVFAKTVYISNNDTVMLSAFKSDNAQLGCYPYSSIAYWYKDSVLIDSTTFMTTPSTSSYPVQQTGLYYAYVAKNEINDPIPPPPSDSLYWTQYYWSLPIQVINSTPTGINIASAKAPQIILNKGKILFKNLATNVHYLLSIYDICGRSVLNRKIESTTTEINLPDISKGLYIANLQSSDSFVSKKIVLK